MPVSYAIRVNIAWWNKLANPGSGIAVLLAIAHEVTILLEIMIFYYFQIQVPFDEYFRVDTVAKYHSAITMEAFMEEIAPKIWPPSKRLCE